MASTSDPAPDHGMPWWHEGSGPEPGRHHDGSDAGHTGDDRQPDMAAAAADAATQAARAADALLRQARVVGWQETVAGGLGLLGAFMRAAAEGTPTDDEAAAASDAVEVEIVEVEIVVDEADTDTHDDARDDADTRDDARDDTDTRDDTRDDADTRADTAADASGPAGRRWEDAGLPPQLAPWLDVGAGLLVESLTGARDHVRTGECRSCPVCRGLAVLRETNPDVVDGIGDALDVLVAMLASDDQPDWR